MTEVAMGEPLKEFLTEYFNEADDGAPYVGPVIRAASLGEACALVETSVRGPNRECLIVLGEIVDRLPADRHGDTKTWVRL